MLVLSRHRDESVMIGDDIVITVVDIRGDKVRFGISAPIEIEVDREEIRAIKDAERATLGTAVPGSRARACYRVSLRAGRKWLPYVTRTCNPGKAAEQLKANGYRPKNILAEIRPARGVPMLMPADDVTGNGGRP